MNPCILIPCYNHAGPLAAVLARLAEFELPCLLVDDGSEPVAAAALDALAAQHPWVSLLRHSHNQGKGGAVMTGLRRAHELGFSHALQVDADGQHDLTDLPALLAEARQHPAALVSGRPLYDDSVPKGRLYGRYITHVWVWIETLSFAIKDSMCGFRVYPLASTCALLERVALGRRMDFDTEVMVRLHWAGVPMRFVPTRVIYPVDGRSHFRLFRDNLDISWMHTRLVCRLLWDLLLRLCRWPARLGARLTRLWRERRTHWSRTPERGSLLGMQIMLASYRLLGRRGFSLLLYPVIGYFWLTGRAQREASRAYLARLETFANAQGVALPAEPRSSFRHFLRFGEAALDKLAGWRGDITEQQVELVGAEHYQTAINSGKGVLLLGSHLGDLELCRALGSRKQGLRINALVFTRHAARFNALLKQINPDSHLNLIQVQELGADTAILLKEKLELGEWVVIVGDRTSVTREKRVIWADFLGAPAPFPLGPFVLSSVLGCPVYLMFGLKEQGRFRVHFEPFADGQPLPRQGRQQILASRVQAYADRLQHHCLRAPLDWFNFFDFWQLTDEQE
ncbi:glycosyltransferase family 2 protein [Aeromonas dhakensis]|uniref:glycosyltransferase family 2 protein n=1 Tax=Aeromonas dhakensis TaxID=196024 RepID=UPI00035E1839|nr:glycosyltransferase family 2 protein [Aeromonas dhakensis]MBF8450550.1 glycosyltransferase family 2 protein [Aeromonas dhakensis]MBQ4680716.1 glycosyltransferase [Aeromonas dhakensis]MBW3730107.1 glycosyltransferase family 2 protein [Aeromonas dhakensis]QSR54820.1 glycosyltransferase [Aeromonas dhakensis]HDX8403049.1 glycosyltransferase family 2 protein [Aeromonas dhakensis]